MWPYDPITAPWILLAALAQSLAILTLERRVSLVSISPSLHARASKVSGSVIPWITTGNAPMKLPDSSRAMAATDAKSKFLEVAASTLIFAHPLGGGIQIGQRFSGCLPSVFLLVVKPRSAINLDE